MPNSNNRSDRLSEAIREIIDEYLRDKLGGLPKRNQEAYRGSEEGIRHRGEVKNPQKDRRLKGNRG